MIFGSREWLESQYASVAGDPWGLDWRPSQRYRYYVMLEALRHHLTLGRTPTRAVDVGCATGDFTSMLASLLNSPEDEVTGVDIADVAIVRARVRHPHLDFSCMSLDACADQYAGKIDLVSCLEVLYYIPRSERSEALKRIKSMMRPNGLLLISSMISRKPYMSPDELRDLVASEFNILDQGVLSLKPLGVFEKLLLRLRRGMTAVEGRGPFLSLKSVDTIASISRAVLGRAAQSHTYVVAQRI